ncbi:hypothetical protein L218DRAFT_955568 [Marasmius fiardii PR-910]|nr:hypothetical protein L218DRAFT_955568 [Marasmius fiardii PR-910]
MPALASGHQPPSSANMIPPFSHYDPENVANDPQQFHAQRYQEWIDSYAAQQQQSTHSSYPSYENQQNHQFTFSQPLPGYRTTGQFDAHAYPPPPSDVYGYNTGSDVHPSTQNHPQSQENVYQNVRQYSSEIPGVAGSSNVSSHGHSPGQWSNETSAATPHSTSPNPSPSPAYGVAVSRGQQQPQSHASNPPPKNNTFIVTSTGSSPQNRSAAKRKRPLRRSPIASSAPIGSAKRVKERDLSDDESGDDDDFGISVGMGGLTGMSGTVSGKKGKIVRLPGACTHCKKLKMKCDFPEGDNTCKRCKSGGHVCIVEGRKPRTAPNKREYLLAQIRQKDAIIESLLRQLHNPYIATPLSIASYRMATSPSDSGNRNVIAWLDRLQSSVQNAGGKIGNNAFKLDGRSKVNEDEDDSGEEETMTHAQRFGLVDREGGTESDEDRDGTDEAGDEADQNTRRLQSSLPDSHVPLGLIANLSLSNSSKKTGGKKDGGAGGVVKKEDLFDEADLDDDNVGVANETYFMPGPATDLDIRATLIEQHSPPEILVHGLVTPDDVERLFEIFYTRVNPFVSLLDPVLHTPASTFARCPFLFTVICAVSSRYYAEKSEIYPIAMHFAKHSAANALVDGWKSVELCQAYILMSIYAVPARRWEEDRSWLYTGLAIRIATDLNLHMVPTTKPHNEKQEREILNRTRVWMTCFNLDRSTATQLGKPSTIKEDYILRNSADWFMKSQYNLDFDVHLCAYTALLKIVAKFHEEIFSDFSSPSGLNKRVDFRSVTLKHDENLIQFEKEWTERFKERLKPDDLGAAFRCSLLPFLVAYSRLVMFSFGFQQAYQRGVQHGDTIFLTKCLESAKGVITCLVDTLAPSGYMRYSPDGHFMFASFASAFLLKLLRPEFSNLLPKEEGSEIYQLIGRLIQTLSSPSIAIDDRHTPKLYARFLAGLLSHHRRDGATVGRLQPQPPPQHQAPGRDYAQQASGGSGPSSSTLPTFSVSPSSTNPHGQSSGYSTDTYNDGTSHINEAAVTSTPIYRPEITYTAGAGPIQLDIDTALMDFEGTGTLDGSETLATMQALNNPKWWTNMMMPGFSWPDAQSSPSNSPTPPSYQHQQQQVEAMYTHHQNTPPGSSYGSSYGIFHAAPQRIPLSGY